VGIPDLLSFFGAKLRLNLALNSLVTLLIHEFKDVVMPEHSVFNEASITQSADYSAVLVYAEIKYCSLYF
jgi:hypothetical protein